MQLKPFPGHLVQSLVYKLSFDRAEGQIVLLGIGRVRASMQVAVSLAVYLQGNFMATDQLTYHILACLPDHLSVYKKIPWQLAVNVGSYPAIHHILLASSPGHSQILSRSAGEKLGEGQGSLLRHEPDMVDLVNSFRTNRVHYFWSVT